MPEPDSGDAGGVVGQRAHALRENRHAACRVADDQVLRIFVSPCQACVVAEYPYAQAMFVAGCGGDQNPIPRRAFELAERYGRQLADSVSSVVNATMRPSYFYNAFLFAGLVIVILFPEITLWLPRQFGMR